MSSRTRAISPERALLVAALVVVVALAVRTSVRYHGSTVDDALIAFQYAKHLATGQGLVFNPGERVEGYTSFLWIVLVAPLWWLARSATAFVPLAAALSILLAAADLVVVWLLARRLCGDRALAVAAALGLCALDPSYAPYAALAFEIHLLVFFVLVATWLTVAPGPRRAVRLGVVLACAAMTRPDALLLGVAVVAGDLAALALRRRDRSARLRDVTTTTAVWLALYGLYFAWRFRYYGDPLPNTYYLKLGSSHFDGWARGVAYAKGFVVARGWVPLLALAAAPFALRPGVRALLPFALLHAIYVVWAGGDFYEGHRFLVPLVPVVALLAARVVAALARRAQTVGPRWLAPTTVALAAAAVALVASGANAPGSIARALDAIGEERAGHRASMRWLGAHAPEASIAADDVGAAGFYGDLRVVDVLGVVDRDIAHRDVFTLGRGLAGHEKSARLFDVLARRPTFIERELFWDDLRRRGYVLRTDVPVAGGIWVRADVATRMP